MYGEDKYTQMNKKKKDSLGVNLVDIQLFPKYNSINKQSNNKESKDFL